MAEETVTSTDTPIIPDAVLEEFEKVSQIEKDVRFLQFRQGAVEKSLTEFREIIKPESAEKTNEENVISDNNSKEETENKDLVKQDKLKPQLDTIEKKRYENIGVEFAKGAEKVFRELKKAEELKKKMSTKNLETAKIKVDKKKEEKTKKKGGLGSMLLKLGLAIAAVVAVIEVFKEKIDEIIPNFSTNYNNFTQPIKDAGDKITNAISGYLSNTIGGLLRNTFTDGDNSVKSLLVNFLTMSLPNVIYQSGLALIEAFGGNVNTSMQYIDSQLQGKVDAALGQGAAADPALRAAEAKARNNMGVLLDPLATESALRAARAEMGKDAMALVGNGLLESFGKVLLGNNDAQNAGAVVTSSYASALMTALTESYTDTNGQQKNVVLDDGINDEELRHIHGRLAISENFETWKNRPEVQNLFGNGAVNTEGIKNLNRAVQNFNDRAQRFRNRSQLNEVNQQLTTTTRQDVIREGQGTVTLTVEPVKLAQDAFVFELNQIYETFKNGVFGSDFGARLLNSVTDVTKYAYEQFLLPMFTIVQESFPWIKSEMQQQNQNNQGNSAPQQPNRRGSNPQPSSSSSSTPPSSPRTIQVNGNGNNPVVVIDFSLSPTVVNTAQAIADVKNEIITYVKQTNEKLKTLKDITVNSKSLNENETRMLNDFDQRIKNNETAILTNTTNIDTIVKYIESHDSDDGQEQPIDDFVLQSRAVK